LGTFETLVDFGGLVGVRVIAGGGRPFSFFSWFSFFFLVMVKGDYVSGVMKRLNELGWDDGVAGAFAGSDTTEVGRCVEAVFRDAWRKGVALLPKDYFDSVSFADGGHVFDVAAGTGFVVLPGDFYLLRLFALKGWRKGCFVAVEENDAVAAVQSNGFVRGNFVRPVCTLSERAGYGRVLNYYSLPPGKGHVIESALYIPLVDGIEGVDDDEVLGFDERLYGPLQWLNAGLVFSLFEKEEMAKVCEGRAVSLI
jgi:hypothetical protein